MHEGVYSITIVVIYTVILYIILYRPQNLCAAQLYSLYITIATISKMECLKCLCRTGGEMFKSRLAYSVVVIILA